MSPAVPHDTALGGCTEQMTACWVAVPPAIEPSAVDLTVLENGTVSLECLASGLPAPGEPVLSLSSCSCIPGVPPRSPW